VATVQNSQHSTLGGDTHQ